MRTSASLRVALLGAIIGFLTVPVFVVRPDTGIDPSWHAALQMARDQGLRWGREIVFTYGPLGFLDSPRMFVPTLAVTAIILGFAAHVLLVGWATWRVSRSVPLWGAAPILYGVFAIVVWRQISKGQTSSMLAVLALAGILLLLWRTAADEYPRMGDWQLVGLGVLIGVLGLVKVNDASVAVLGGGVGILGVALQRARSDDDVRSGIRTVGIFAASVLTTFVMTWILAGQHLSDLIDYVAGGGEIAAGFAPAMVKPLEGSDLLTLGSAAVLGLGVLAWLIAETRRSGASPGAVACAVGLGAICLSIWFRQGFVRHDGFEYFGFVAVLLVLAWGRLRLLPGVLVATAVLLAFLSAGGSLTRPLEPDRYLANLSRTASVFLDAEERSAISARGRERLLEEYGFSTEVRDVLDGHRVHVDPTEVAAAWALGPDVSWAPPPVFQDYQAYSSPLDQMNATYLADEGPDFIIREQRALDGKPPYFLSPEAELVQACRYREVLREGRWRLLRRGADSCGQEMRTETGQSTKNAPLSVPQVPRGHLLVGRFETSGAGLGQAIRGLVYAPKPPSIILDGQTFRFVRGHEDQPHLLTAPSCVGEALGVPASLEQMQMELDVRVSFSIIPVAC